MKNVKIGNQPPSKPIIIGPRYGDPDQELTYTFTSEDYEKQEELNFLQLKLKSKR